MPNITEPDIIALIEKTLDLKLGSLGPDSSSEEFDNWDSLGQLSILVDLDILFEGKIASIDTMAQATSLPKIFAVLKQHSLL